MSWQIKLKTGFFETKPYRLTVSPHAIRLSPQDNAQNAITIAGEQLLCVSLTRQAKDKAELEIRTGRSVYICSLLSADDISGAEAALKAAFDRKLKQY